MMTRMETTTEADPTAEVGYWGGHFGALAPFAVFLSGVAWLALSGAPDERGFWPILLAALGLGLALARDREAYCEAMIRGMSQPLVMLMIVAWLLAGVFAALMRASGLIDSLVWLAHAAEIPAAGFVVASFAVCSAVATATGTSLGTLILCLPLLYPAGLALGAHPAILVGAILGGATFGDNISPVSDTTIASATTQRAGLGEVVRSRLRYALPAATLALVAYALLGALGTSELASPSGIGNRLRQNAFPMAVAPGLVVILLLRRCHLITGLMTGIAAAAAIGMFFGLLDPGEILFLDTERFSARGLIVDGMERALGVSIFTLLLMGLLATLEASGLLTRLLAAIERRTTTPQRTEWWIFGAISTATLLTTHSTVAILAVGPAARRLGHSAGIGRLRRSNLLDVTACTYPFLLPYCIPTILAASLTAGFTLPDGSGHPTVSALDAGLYNFHSWGLLLVILIAVGTGYGRVADESE